jgi:hypothetical protein
MKAGDVSWEKLVPPPIAQVIRTKRLFGWNEKNATVTA